MAEQQSRKMKMFINIKSKDIEKQISMNIVKDYQEFKKKNELVYCSMHQSKPNGNLIDVTWSTTIRYNETLLDLSKVEQRFDDFNKTNYPDYCQITKITSQEGVHIVEFSAQRTYELHFLTENLKNR
jgi:hypothetical protein